jgi:hypothetical protein
MFTPKKLALQVSKKTFLYKYLLFPLGFKQASSYTNISSFHWDLNKQSVRILEKEGNYIDHNRISYK